MNSFYENSVYRLGEARIEGGYRYYLRGEILKPKSARHLVVVQLNPSKANGKRSDATAGKVCNWAARNDFAVIHFVNLFARIATVQSDVRQDISYEELVGAENDRCLNNVLDAVPKDDSRFVFAYGQPEGVLYDFHSKRVGEIEALLSRHRVKEIFRVGPLSNGKFPRHGRAWNKDVGLEALDIHALAKN